MDESGIGLSAEPGVAAAVWPVVAAVMRAVFTDFLCKSDQPTEPATHRSPAIAVGSSDEVKAAAWVESA